MMISEQLWVGKGPTSPRLRGIAHRATAQQAADAIKGGFIAVVPAIDVAHDTILALGYSQDHADHATQNREFLEERNTFLPEPEAQADPWVPKRHLEYGNGLPAGDFENRTEPFYRAHRMYGQGADTMFKGGGPTAKPWSGNRTNDRRQELITAHIIGRMLGFAETELIDTRWLQMSQDAVVGHIVRHYAGEPEYRETGMTFTDRDQAGNLVPLVYQRAAQGDRTILSGHHRSAAALAQGLPVEALVVRDDDESVLREARRRGYKI